MQWRVHPAGRVLAPIVAPHLLSVLGLCNAGMKVEFATVAGRVSGKAPWDW